MREILFRGKKKNADHDILDFVYGYLTDYSIIKDEHGNSHVVHKETIGQYTGLKDKNGNKIFEGDVLNHKIQGERIVYYPFNERSAMFGLNCIKNGFKNYLKDSEIYEVIGNIHDN